jgi:ATP-binding cassette, subfamily B, bacterial MsbA
MNSFGRAIKLALAHRANVLGCILTAFAVALLWGGNLTAVWPVVDVIMNDSALPQWVDQKIAEGNKEIADNQQWLARLDQLQAKNPKEIEAAIHEEIEHCQAELADHIDKSTGVWTDIQIAEKTRLTNFIANLEKIQKKPAKLIVGEVESQKWSAKHQIDVYRTQVKHYGWIAPYAHRWLPTTPFSTLVLVCVLVLIGTLLKNVFRIWNQILVARMGNMVGYDLRMEYYRAVLRLDMTDFSDSGRGDLMNRCTSDLNSLREGVQKLFGNALLEPLKVVVCVAIAASVSWQLLLLTVTTAPVAGWAIHWLGRALKRTHRKAMQELSFIYERLGETLGGIKLIQAYTMEAAERNKFHHSSKEYFLRQMKIAMYNSLVGPVVETLGIGMVLVAALLGGYLVLGQHTHVFGIKISDIALTHGQMSVFFAMLAGMADPGRRLSQEFGQIQQGAAAADRVYEVIDRVPKIVDPAEPIPLPHLTKSIHFENIAFHYHPDKQILHDVDLEVRIGETIAIVGHNGCGKTTLLQLLPRFYDPQAGRVTVDGIDVRDVRLRDLRGKIGLVTQETLLFNDTVANNIRYGRLDATQAEIESAARKAYAHTFITERLSDGYQTIVGPGGGRLSGGQRQRIVLARAILRDPEILILDEATSQIDVESERLIQQVLDEFTRDRTTILITHRVSSIALADRVVVMDKGRILDVGAPDELSSRCELYRRLCHSGYRESA